MSARSHIQTLCVATAVWVAFWVLGLPGYYQQYPRATMMLFCITLVPPIVVLSYVRLGRIRRGRRLARAAWLAFYFTLPLAFYDWLYCGIHLGYGMRFLQVFWYVTVFYIVPWIVLPATAVVLNRFDRATESGPHDSDEHRPDRRAAVG